MAVEEGIVASHDLGVERSRGANDVEAGDGGGLFERREATRGGADDEERLINVGAQLLDRHHRIDAAAEGRENATGVDEWFVGFDADSTLDRDVAQWELITIRELAQSVRERGLEESSSVSAERRRPDINTASGPGLVVRESGDEVPELGEGDDGRRLE